MTLFSQATPSDNPWSENTKDRGQAALAVVIRSRIRAHAVAQKLPRLAKDLEAFCTDLTAVEAIYRKDPSAFRKVRALTAVHLPAIIASLETLAQNQDQDPARIHAIETDLRACLIASREARQTLEGDALLKLEVETQTLRGAVSAPRTEENPTEQINAGIKGRFNRIVSKGSQAVSDTLDDGRKHLGAIGGETTARLGAGAGLARSYVVNLVEDGYDRVTSPINHRITAIGSALSDASAAALVGGIVTAIVFPPAIPVALGVSLLSGASSYDNALKGEERKTEMARGDRQRKRQQEQAGMLRKFQGKSPLVRMETPHVHVTMNPQTGEATGTILTGRHTGESMSDLGIPRLTEIAATAPDPETREIILAFRNRLKAEEAAHAPATANKKSGDAAEITLLLGLEALIGAAIS